MRELQKKNWKALKKKLSNLKKRKRKHPRSWNSWRKNLHLCLKVWKRQNLNPKRRIRKSRLLKPMLLPFKSKLQIYYLNMTDSWKKTKTCRLKHWDIRVEEWLRCIDKQSFGVIFHQDHPWFCCKIFILKKSYFLVCFENATLTKTALCLGL